MYVMLNWGIVQKKEQLGGKQSRVVHHCPSGLPLEGRIVTQLRLGDEEMPSSRLAIQSLQCPLLSPSGLRTGAQPAYCSRHVAERAQIKKWLRNIVLQAKVMSE